MVCMYLGPLSCGFAKGVVYAGNNSTGFPNWTEHLLLLGGLTSNVFALTLMLRIVGRLRTSATVTILLLLISIAQMFLIGEDENGRSGKRSKTTHKSLHKNSLIDFLRICTKLRSCIFTYQVLGQLHCVNS